MVSSIWYAEADFEQGISSVTIMAPSLQFFIVFILPQKYVWWLIHIQMGYAPEVVYNSTTQFLLS